VDQRLRQLHALLHAGRVAADRPVALLEQADVAQDLGGPLTRRVARQARHATHVRDEVGGRHVGWQAVVLRQVADAGADLGSLRGGIEILTRARPDVGSSSPSRIRISVLLPAPFEPSSPTTPGSIVTVRSSSAVTDDP
jgi:hypothetical protein